MTKLSPETQRLIYDLTQRQTFLKALTSSHLDVSLLRSIGNSKEPAVVIEMLPFVLSRRNDVAEAAATAIHKLILETTTQELAWLDEALRLRSSWSGDTFYEWSKLSPEQLPSFERFDLASVALLGMASFHRSGFVREAAVRALERMTTGAELKFLILRLNDWVPNVRDAAYAAVRVRLTPAYGAGFLANLPLILRLESAGRTNHADLLQSIYDLLQSEECLPLLRESLKSDSRLVRRASFRLFLNSQGNDLPEVVREALADRDTVIRLTAARMAGSTYTGESLEQLLALMKRDRYMPVRREALRCVVKLKGEQARDELVFALLDPHASMREEARYHLREDRSIDFAGGYRKALSDGNERDLYAALSGLGETGSATDDRLVLPFLHHAASRVRRAALRALARLNGRAHVEAFFKALNDEIPANSRQAMKALSDKTALISAERIWEMFDSSEETPVRRNALYLLERLGKWESIYYLIRATQETDQALAGLVNAAIERWLIRFNRSFTQPTDDQIARLARAFEAVGDQLSARTQEQIGFILKGHIG